MEENQPRRPDDLGREGAPGQLAQPAALLPRMFDLPRRMVDVSRPHVIYGIALALVAILPMLSTFAAAQLKGMFESFTSGCQCVIEKNIVEGKMQVKVKLAGTMPKTLPLTFASTDSKLRLVQLMSPHLVSGNTDMAAPPMAGERCPGNLCDAPSDAGGFESLRLIVASPRPEFAYNFEVTLTPIGNPALSAFSGVHVYASFSGDHDQGVCRVELAQWHNFWIWGSTLQKSLLFIAMIILAGFLVRAAKARSEA